MDNLILQDKIISDSTELEIEVYAHETTKKYYFSISVDGGVKLKSTKYPAIGTGKYGEFNNAKEALDAAKGAIRNQTIINTQKYKFTYESGKFTPIEIYIDDEKTLLLYLESMLLIVESMLLIVGESVALDEQQKLTMIRKFANMLSDYPITINLSESGI